MTESKLNFVIGGAQKCGTSTLYHIFLRHPQIQMATLKETHFFDDESRDWQNPDYSELESYFSANDSRLRGEATPITLYWRPAIRRLRNYNPNLKFIFLLRNPVTRAFSNWQHERAAGRETRTFHDAIRGGREGLRQAAEADSLRRYIGYVERGFYGAQLSYLLEFFPKENVLCEISEDFFQDRSPALRRIAAFLGIEPFTADLPPIHANSTRDLPYPSILTEDDIEYLFELFRGDIAGVESFLGRPIPNWRSRNPAAGILPENTHEGRNDFSSAPDSSRFIQRDSLR